MFKTVLIVFLLLAIIAIGGGSFYYFEIYQSREYAGSALLLYQKIENTGLEPDTSAFALRETSSLPCGSGVVSRNASMEECARGAHSSFSRM